MKKMSKTLKTPKGDENKLVESIEIENTPFVARKFGSRWILTIGDSRLKQEFQSYEEAERFISNPDWNTIVTVIYAIVKVINNIKSI